jgi:RHS repeat-associated protein
LQKSFSPSNLTGSKQTGLWLDNTTWLSGTSPTLNDKVTINSGHTVTIPNGQKVSAGMLVDNGILKNFGTLNMGNVKASTSSNLYSLNFKYHIRSGLKGINTDASGNLTNNIFSYRLDYEEGTGGFFDGNIKKQSWKSNIDGKERSFTFDYDGASRLKSGLFSSTQTGESYSLNNVDYDLNSNITALSRNGLKSNNTFGLIDNLAYSYNSNSNKILKIDDTSNETASFKDVAGNDYDYWLDGSLKKDNNKDITQIDYNYLKLPEQITLTSGRWIKYEYDANGVKLKKTLSTGKVTEYEEDDIYENEVLYQTAHDEGRVVDGIYEYDIKDHLGNLRVSFKDSLGIAKITQVNAYGAWGDDLPTLKYINSLKKNNFTYSTYEKEDDFGIGVFDAHARIYDPLAPRFWQIDPLSELSRRFSPFVYGNANPLRFIDSDGMMASDVGADGLTTDQWVQNAGDEEKNKESKQENRDKERDKKKSNLTTKDKSQSGIGVGSVGGQSVSEARDEQIKEKGRPDIDGQLTYAEAGEWSHYGNGVSLTIDAGKVDFSDVYSNEVPFEGKGSPLRVNLKGSNFSNLNDAVVYGNVLLVKDLKGRVKVLHDEYNFETGAPAHPWYGKNSSFWRNVITILGSVANGGSGTKYNIDFIGFANVSPGSRPLPSGPTARPESERRHRRHHQ